MAPDSFEKCEAEVEKVKRDHVHEMEKQDQQLTRKRALAHVRVGMLSACQRKRLAAETDEECDARLAKMAENQQMRVQCESEKQRAARLARL